MNPNPLAARVARLEQIVTALAGQKGGGEQLSPNYLTVTPDGQIGAKFTGLVNALGLIIPAATSSPVLQNLIAWEDANSTVIAELFGQSNAGQELLSIIAQAKAAGDSAQIAISAIDQLGDVQAQLLVEQTAGTSGEVTVEAGAQSLRLLDFARQSHWTQSDPAWSITPGYVSLMGGRGVVTWTSTGTNSAPTQVSTGRLTHDALLLVTGTNGFPAGGISNLMWNVELMSANPCVWNVNAATPGTVGAGNEAGFYWLFVGW